MKEVEAIILAGGFGSRMGELTREQQKCLLPIDGRPIIGSIIDELIAAFGSVDVKVGVAFQAIQVKDYLDRNTPRKAKITYVPHEPGVDTYGAYKTMEEHVKGPFVGLPGDALAREDAYRQVYEHYERTNFPINMSFTPNLSEARTHGVGKILLGQVIMFEWPAPEIPGGDCVRDMTVYASDQRLFGLMRKYESTSKGLSTIVAKSLEEQTPIGGTIYESTWIHLATQEDLKKSMYTTYAPAHQ